MNDILSPGYLSPWWHWRRVTVYHDYWWQIITIIAFPQVTLVLGDSLSFCRHYDLKHYYLKQTIWNIFICQIAEGSNILDITKRLFATRGRHRAFGVLLGLLEYILTFINYLKHSWGVLLKTKCPQNIFLDYKKYEVKIIKKLIGFISK